MQHDDRERDEAAGAPDDDNAQQGAQGDAQRAAPEPLSNPGRGIKPLILLNFVYRSEC